MTVELILEFLYFLILYPIAIANFLKYLTFVRQPHIFKFQNVKSDNKVDKWFDIASKSEISTIFAFCKTYYTGSQKELLTSKNNSLFRNFSAQNENVPYKSHNKKVYLY